MSLDAIFKAYDIRGVYPDEIDEALARRIGNAFARFTGAQHRDRRPRHAAVVGAARRRRSSRARRSPAPTSSTSGWPPPTSSTSRPGSSTRPARCSPRATTRRSTTASSCAGPAPRRSASRPGLHQIKEMVAAGRHVERAEVAGKVEQRRPARRVRRARALVRRHVGAAAAHGRRRHRQRHGRPRRAQGVRGAAVRRSRCSSASSTARSRTTRPTRSSPRTSKDLQQRGARRRRRHRPRVRRRRRPRVPRRRPGRSRCRGSTTTAIVAAGILDRHPRRDGRAQPHLLEGACPRSSARTAACRCAPGSGTRSSSR